MKQFLVFIIFLGCFLISSAEPAVEVHHEENRIISISRSQTRVNDLSKTFTLSKKGVKKLLEMAKEVQKEQRDVLGINDVADDIISTVQRDMLIGHGDPLDIDDRTIAFEFRPWLITYSGTLDLDVGRIQDLSTFSRAGDATLSWNSLSPTTVTISIPLNFRQIIATYNFLLRVRGDTVPGVLHAWKTDTTANYNAVIDIPTFTLTSRSLNLNIGSVAIDVFSASISNSYRNLVTELTTDLMTDIVIEEADIVTNLLTDALLLVVDELVPSN